MFPSQRQNNLNHRNNNYIVNYLAIDNTIRFGGLVNDSGTLINKPELIDIDFFIVAAENGDNDTLNYLIKNYSVIFLDEKNINIFKTIFSR